MKCPKCLFENPRDIQSCARCGYELNISLGLSPKEITNIERAIRWNLLMSDFSKLILGNNQKSQFYMKETQKLKNQLQKIRINE